MTEFDQRKMQLHYELNDDDGEWLTVPALWATCSRCRGKGQHSLAVDGHGITQEERERDWSDDMWEDYMNGGYDRTCERCDGRGSVPVPNWARINEKDKARLEAHFEDERQYQAMVAAELRYGA